MPTPPASFSFGDPLGATVAFVYFSALSAVVGAVVFHVSCRLMRGAYPSAGASLHRSFISVSISLGVAGVIFGALYVSSLSGFYEVELRGDHVSLQYILPAQTKDLSLAGIVQVTRMPTFKGQWRLVIATASGQVYQSVHASPATVQEAVGALRYRIAGTTERQSRAIPSSGGHR
ncbi:MAG: hypothetical protein HZB35_04110 [Nitrospirae bacterium]|nr:hypothetical protein [Nitrospirota bacterium]